MPPRSLDDGWALVHRWTERLDSPGRAAALGAAGLGALLLGALVWLALRPAGTAPSDEALFGGPVTTLASGPATTVAEEPAPDLVVHAAGAVAVPGVYVLPVGSRVDDLLARAGGTSPDADVDRLNRAAPLADGQRLYVPRHGEEAPSVVGPDGGGASAPGTAGRGADGAGQAGPIDLNTADAEELDALPGVGPATAAAIVDHRERHGPFTSVDGLLDVRGIGPAKLEALRELVTVR